MRVICTNWMKNLVCYWLSTDLCKRFLKIQSTVVLITTIIPTCTRYSQGCPYSLWKAESIATSDQEEDVFRSCEMLYGTLRRITFLNMVSSFPRDKFSLMIYMHYANFSTLSVCLSWRIHQLFEMHLN